MRTGVTPCGAVAAGEDPAASASLLVSAWRPPTYGQVLWAHLPLALAVVALLVLPWLKLRLGIGGIPCLMLAVTGVPCPFCGFTRALAAMVSGDAVGAWLLCPLACLVFVAACVVGLWNVAALVTGLRLKPGRVLRPFVLPGRVALLLVAMLVLLNWAYRVHSGLN